MSIEQLIASHLRLAKSNLEACEFLLANNNRNAAYQAEQAVEQIILALAQSETIHYERHQHHQLDTMAKLLPEQNSFRVQVRDLCWLEAYATTFRYPRTRGSIPDEPPRARLQSTSQAIADVMHAVSTYFGVDLNSSTNLPAQHGRPPRNLPVSKQ